MVVIAGTCESWKQKEERMEDLDVGCRDVPCRAEINGLLGLRFKSSFIISHKYINRLLMDQYLSFHRIMHILVSTATRMIVAALGQSDIP